MNIKSAGYLFLATVLCAPFQAFAAKEKYEFDRGHTRIFFEVNHLGFSDYRGMFHEYAGGFVFDTDKLEESSIEVTVDMSSADMYFEKMNEHLLNEDLLHVTKYPDAKFVSTAVKPKGKDRAQVTGNLTLLGVTKPVVLDVQFNRAAENPFSKKFTRGFTATGTIDRTEFGIDYAVPLVSKEVKLTISVEAYRVD